MAVDPQLYRRAVADPLAFSALGGITLRPYQEPVLRCILDSVLGGHGRSIAVMFPRQSGKNELQAQLEAYLLNLYAGRGGEIVKVCPTWQPQGVNSRRRLQRVLRANPITRGRWRVEDRSVFRLGEARLLLFSAAPASSIVGATASLLLEVDEAQQVLIDKYDRDVAPMAASSNATRVFWGTPWTDTTLLARELRRADAAFTLTADDVAAVLPGYGAYVAGQVAQLGRDDPTIRTQYFGEEIGGGGGMFPPDAALLLQGDHPALDAPQPGRLYAFLIDVGGETFASGPALATPRLPEHDRTALTVVEVDLEAQSNLLLRLPTYRAVHRRVWMGEPQAALHTRLTALAGKWQPRALVIDATGIGAGLASFLQRSLPRCGVMPFVFTAASKSKLGWEFVQLVEAGRWQESAPGGAPEQDALRALFLRQVAAAACSVLPGPSAAMRWSVPERARDPLSGKPLHDDLLLSAALAAQLDGLAWRSGHGLVAGVDPLAGMEGF